MDRFEQGSVRLRTVDRQRARAGQTMIGIVAVLVILSIMAVIEFGGGGSSRNASAPTLPPSVSKTTGSGPYGGYNAIIAAAKNAAAHDGGTVPTLPGSGTATTPVVASPLPGGGSGITASSSILVVAKAVAKEAVGLSGLSNRIASDTDPITGSSYVALAFEDVAGSFGDTLSNPSPGKFQLVNTAKSSKACITISDSVGASATVTSGAC